MPQFTPNLEAEANTSFDVVQPGVYDMRVAEISDFTSAAGNHCLKVRLEFIDPTGCAKLDGTPASNPGNVFDNGLVISPADKQGRLRNFVEACGETWGNVTDTDTLVGKEVKVKLKTEEYQGELGNKVSRYVV